MSRTLQVLGGVTGALLLAATTPANATIFAGGVVSTPFAGAPVTVSALAPYVPGEKLYLRISGAALSATWWRYDTEIQYLNWYSLAGASPFLEGNEISTGIEIFDDLMSSPSTGHIFDETFTYFKPLDPFSLHYTGASTLELQTATFVFNDLSPYFSDCADPYKRPFGIHCAVTHVGPSVLRLGFVAHPTGDSFSWTLASAPEPTTWALTIAGTSLAGTALRRRRRLAAPT